MSEPREPEPAVPGESTADPLEVGLKIGFGRPNARPDDSGVSVLVALEAATGRLPRLRLREDEEAADPLEATAAADVPEPREDAGRYQVVGELARGGVGSVLRGRDLDLGRDVAMKVLLEEHAGSARLVQRFVEEAQIGGQLQHPGVVPVYEMGLRPDRRPYFTMKLVKGETLAALQENRIDATEERSRFLGIFRQVLHTVAYAHARGVVHRDLKPANIMVGTFGEVLVMDWGLAKVLSRGGVADEPRPEARAAIETVRTGRPGTQSLAGSILGTPAYMPPEQARGEVDRLDERADVFALGAILTEILTGKPPYAGESAAALREAAAEGRLDEAWSRLEQCSADAELVAIARACLAPRRRDRPRSAEVVAERFGAYLAAVEARARRAKLEAAAARARATEEENARRLAESLATAERRRRRLTVGLAVAALAVVAAAAGSFMWLEAERRKRVVTRTASVRETMAEAAEHRGQAAWARAIAAAERAVRLAAEGDLQAGVAARARALLDEVRGEADTAKEAADRAKREQELLARLEAIRGRAIDRPPPREQVADYMAALSAFGLDLDRVSVDDAAHRIRETAIAVELAAALDDCSGYVGALRKRGGVTQASLRGIVLAADPDPLRTALRRARYDRNAARVKELLAAADVGSLPAATLTLFAPLLGDLAAEAAFLKRAHGRYPGDFWINYLLAVVHIQSRDHWHPAAAVPHSEAAVALRPQSAAAWDLHGNVLAGVLDHDQAVAAHETAVRLRPDDHHYWIHLGKTLYEKGDLEDALAATKKAIALHADCRLAHSNLGLILSRRGNIEEAHAAHRVAVRPHDPGQRPSDPQPYVNYGAFLCDRLGKFDEAIEQFEFVIAHWPKDTEAYFNLAVARGRKGDVTGQIAAFEDLIEARPESAAGYVGLSGILIDEKQQYAEALELLEKALERAPEDAAAHYNKGVALFFSDRLDQAMAATRRALAIDPNHARARGFLVLELRKQGDLRMQARSHAEAADSYREAIRVAPKRAGLHYSLGLALVWDRKLEPALAAFREAVRLRPKFTEAHYEIGVTLQELHDPDGALEAFREATRCGPKYYSGWLNLGKLLCDYKQEYVEAEEVFERAIRIAPREFEAHFNLGITRFHMEDYEGAERAFLRVIELKPDLIQGHLELGWVLREQGKFAQAGEAFSAALRLDPEHGPARDGLEGCRKMVALEAKLASVLEGGASPTGAQDLADLAWLAYRKRRYAASARLFAAAFEAEREPVREVARHYCFDAARAAVLAGSGKGEDAATLEKGEAVRWRWQALTWLREELAHWKGRARAEARGALSRWLRDDVLAAVRDEAGLTRLPAPEREAWQAFWSDVAATLAAVSR